MKHLTIILFLFFIPLVSFAHGLGEDFVIEMTENGFEPSVLEIQQGDSVIFKNHDKRDRWPASNIHPTHSIYYEFDPKIPIPPDDSWEFTFTSPGTWRFHDHLSPQLTGYIEVAENLFFENTDEQSDIASGTSLLEKFISLIKTGWAKLASLFRGENSNNFASLSINEISSDKEVLVTYLKEEGIETAMTRLVEESGGGSSFDCHQQAHNIGRIGYNLIGENAFQQCNASCHSGCYHGAMETFLKQEGTSELGQKIDTICNKFSTNFGIFECLHGVGHGVLAYLDYNMPEAIDQCKNLKDSFSQSSCYGGIFMENILTGQGLGAREEIHETLWVNQTDPYFPCNSIDQSNDVQYQCYQMQTSWMLVQSGYDFDVIADNCLNAPENMISVCMRSMGRDISGYTLRNPERIVSLCSKTPKEYYNECLSGALNVIIDFWGPTLTDQVSKLCSINEAPYKNNCYSETISRIAGLLQEKNSQQTICYTMEQPYQDQCLNIYQ